NIQRMLDSVDIIGVADLQHVPSIGEKAGGDILGKSDARVAFDRDVVVVVNPTEVIESQMTGERCRLRADALHQAAVTAHRIDRVIKNVKAWGIVIGGEPLLRNCHADTCSNALPEWAGGGFDARYPVIFRMSRSLAVQLPEMLDIVQRHRRLSET